MLRRTRYHAEVYRDAQDQWRWRVRSQANGKIVADSAEGYHDEGHARRMVRKVCRVRRVVTAD